MLDLRYVLEHLDEVRAGLARRSPAARDSLGPVAELGASRKTLIASLEAKAAARNQANEAMAKADKKSPEFAQRRDELKTLSAAIKDEEKALAELEGRISELLLRVPNLPHPSIPDGSSADDNRVERVWGEAPTFSFAPRDHVELGTSLGILDLERAAKLSGARFAVLYGAGARLERALVSFMLDLHTREHGYREVLPPLLVRDTALLGTGQLPKFKDDLFRTERKGDEGEASYDLYLIPTAEVPVTNLHADEILDEASLPIAYCAYTPCFRAEAGSHGRDVRGLIRQHQFDKVELVRFTRPEDSEAELERLTGHAEEVLRRLGLHHRVVCLSAGDLGGSATKTYDLEVWLPSQGQFREISSCSSFADYQARRASIRYRPTPAPGQKAGKPRLAHTLNGSGLAVGRTLIAVLEQYQQADGSVVVPEALRPYVGQERIERGA